MQGNARPFQSLFHADIKLFRMGPRGNLGDNAPVCGVQFGLPRDDGGQNFGRLTGRVTHDGGGCVVTAALQSKYGQGV